MKSLRAAALPTGRLCGVILLLFTCGCEAGEDAPYGGKIEAADRGQEPTVEQAAVPDPDMAVRVATARSSGSRAFPEPYSLSRQLLEDNPGALVAGDDWQSYGSTPEIAAEFHHQWGWGTSPAECGTVNLVSDPLFVQVPQGQHNDGSTSCKPNEVRYDKTFAGAERAWIRVLWKAEPDYESNSFWKFIWSGSETDGTPIRHLEWTWTGGFAVNFYTQGGAECGDAPGDSCVTLDGAAVPDAGTSGHISRPSSAINDQEWWEWVISQEVLRGAGPGGSDIYRVRMWERPLTGDDRRTLGVPAPAAGPRDYVRKIALESVGANVARDFVDTITLGKNRNDPTSPGHTNYFRWGPWEVIDADVVADPYGLAEDMLLA